MKCDEEIQKILFQCVLSGGNGMFNGTRERLDNQLSNYKSKEIRIWGKKERDYGAWCAGSFLSCNINLNKHWLNSTEYKEMGSESIHYKLTN